MNRLNILWSCCGNLYGSTVCETLGNFQKFVKGFRKGLHQTFSRHKGIHNPGVEREHLIPSSLASCMDEGQGSGIGGCYS